MHKTRCRVLLRTSIPLLGARRLQEEPRGELLCRQTLRHAEVSIGGLQEGEQLLGQLVDQPLRIHRTRASVEGQEPLFDRHRLYVRFLVAEPLLALRSEQFGTETQCFPHITTSFSYHFESLYSKGVLSARRLKNLLKKDGLGKSISSDI